MDQSGSFNTFSNDGSFLEQFKKLQQQQAQQKQEKASLPSVLTPKHGGGVTMKLGGAMKNTKKASTPSLKVVAKDSVVRRAFRDDSSDSEGEQERKEDLKKPHVLGQVSRPPPSSSSSSSFTGSSALTTSGRGSYSTQTVTGPSPSQLAGRKRKRKSRWSDTPSADEIAIAEAMASFSESSEQLTSQQEMQLREQIEMNRLVAEVRAATQKKPQRMGKKRHKYEYDSDEDTEGGTWEHKLRNKEMEESADKAKSLTEAGKGKHHIGDFLPPDELSRFVEKVKAVKEGRDPDLSDYREHKLTEENVGFKLLQKAGWKEGAGLGAKEDGITAPVNKGKLSFDQSGVGVEQPGEVKKEDDEFETYRKRMMLAYRFRPNPLNNPRRPYY